LGEGGLNESPDGANGDIGEGAGSDHDYGLGIDALWNHRGDHWLRYAIQVNEFCITGCEALRIWVGVEIEGVARSVGQADAGDDDPECCQTVVCRAGEKKSHSRWAGGRHDWSAHRTAPSKEEDATQKSHAWRQGRQKGTEIELKEAAGEFGKATKPKRNRGTYEAFEKHHASSGL
jgi:hypothetical protein